jgi:hypothetical protein
LQVEARSAEQLKRILELEDTAGKANQLHKQMTLLRTEVQRAEALFARVARRRMRMCPPPLGS